MDIRIFLGTWNNKEVYWCPEKEKNPHLMITGFSGTGKTNLMKSLIYELSKHNIPCMIIDFDEEFLEFSDIILDMKNLTINPLESTNNIPLNIEAEVSNILKILYKLGDQQTAKLIEAIDRSYKDKGIDITKFVTDSEFPNFSDVRINLIQMMDTEKEDRANIAKLMNKLDFLFKIEIFSKNTAIPYEKLIRSTTVLELKKLPTNNLKMLVAEFYLSKLWHYVSRMDQSRKIRLYCIIDEVHNLAYKGSSLDSLLRGLRKYGIGVIIASQKMSDFHQIISNIGTIVSFQHRSDKDAKAVGREINIDPDEIKNLVEIGSAFVKFASETSARKINVKEYSKRIYPS